MGERGHRDRHRARRGRAVTPHSAAAGLDGIVLAVMATLAVAALAVMASLVAAMRRANRDIDRAYARLRALNAAFALRHLGVTPPARLRRVRLRGGRQVVVVRQEAIAHHGGRP